MTTSVRRLIFLSVMLSPVASIGGSFPDTFLNTRPLDWSRKLATAEIDRRGRTLFKDGAPKARWEYTSGLFAHSLIELGKATGVPDFTQYGTDLTTSFVGAHGSIATYQPEDNNIDMILPGRALLHSWEVTKDPTHKAALDLLRRQLVNQPRTSDGGFWHKRRYPWQMWLDGLYMGSPFLAHYGKTFGEPAAFDEVVRQITLMDRHAYDPATGLYYHGWDEKREQTWANKQTGLSPCFWGRSIGWYAMAIVDCLDDLPPTHEGTAEVRAILGKLAAGVVRHQDAKSGLWWQVMDQGGREGNYLESTASAMFVYAIAKGVNRGYLDRGTYLEPVRRGYEALVRDHIRTDNKGALHLTTCCEVAGLGFTTSKGRPRDGTFEYYVSEPVVEDDLKGVGPFILAGIEVSKLADAPVGGADRNDHAQGMPINREALVTRHNPVIRKIDVDSPVTLGNGGFAFTADATGLQTFATEYHRQGVPTETLCRWAWYSEPNPANYQLSDAFADHTEADGRTVAYPTNATTPASQWLRRNPRGHPLGRLAFVRGNGRFLTMNEIDGIHQSLDLWRGVVTSRFQIDGEAVEVVTTCHPEMDLIAVRMRSRLFADGRLAVSLGFPRGHDISVKHTPGLDWSLPESHTTRVVEQTAHRVSFERRREAMTYHCALTWNAHAAVTHPEPHIYLLKPSAERIECSVSFAPGPLPGTLPDFESTLGAAAKHWERHWTRGGMVDFSGSTDPRAAGLEERIILSQYLTATQMAGAMPPQESGLTCNTWYGKHHTEMIWWHAAHFALWNRDDLLATNLEWYVKQLPAARQLAASRGLKGARWSKMTGPDFRESPGGNPLIVWNQPHPIYLAELLHRNLPNGDCLPRYRELVLESAACLASMAVFDPSTHTYALGPPLWIAQEIHDPRTSRNPCFELAYWSWALKTAQTWRERLGLARDPGWDHIIGHLAPLPQKDGKYVALGSVPDTWDNLASRHDHPTMLAPLGMLPGGAAVDPATMDRTLDAVLSQWDWKTKIWGWDYPMIAMTATRLGRPADAVAILLRDGPNNRYLPTGHCPQRGDQALPSDAPPGVPRREIATYLPANGALLAAVALMAAGWDGCQTVLPGFPKDGTWMVRFENIAPLP